MSKGTPCPVSISAASYRLPTGCLSVEDLERAGLTRSPAAVLRDFGFEYCHLCPPGTPGTPGTGLDDLLLESGREALDRAGTPPEALDRLFLYSGLDPQPSTSPGCEPLALFRYPSARVHHLLGLGQTPVMGLRERGCAGLLSAVDMASRLLQTTEKEAILCLAGDALPPGSPREIMYNLMSDAAGALLIERGGPRNRILAFHEKVQTYYWDTPLHEQELLAAYFPMAERAIIECLQEANLEPSDLAWFVPHNVSLRSWRILADLLSIPIEKVWTSNIPRVGHTVSCDHIINLADMQAQGALSPGDRLALFTFGFGATWSCMVLLH